MIIAIIGPTASGKSALGINLARKFRGEIISADSRQVYKGMDIGTGKVSKAEQKLVSHHLLDVISPKKQFSVTDFKSQAKEAIRQISNRGKVPFVVGGTAFYVYSLIDDLKIPETKPNLKLRKALQKKTVDELFSILKKLDPKRAKSIDKKNPVRLIRAIEINLTTGKPVPSLHPHLRGNNNYSSSLSRSTLFLGMKKDPNDLRKLINNRVDQRLKAGMISETKKLLKNRVTSKRLETIGLTYGLISSYLNGKLIYPELVEKIKMAEYQLSKRQMTWFKKDPRIHWVNNQRQAEALVSKFLNR